MASLRDRLDAYAYARTRTVGAFLTASPEDPEGSAPRPLQAVVPSLVAAAVLVVVFGAVGLISPAAPPGWDRPGANLLIGRTSTARYVVLPTRGGRPELHQVLNLTSARLLLAGGYRVMLVSDSVLDDGRIPIGSALGIPDAPDRIPDRSDAGTPKSWAACEQPGGDPGAVQRAAFVLASGDARRVGGADRLTGAQALYVRAPDGTRYLVDAAGTAFPFAGPDGGTGPSTALFGSATPQPVSADWLAALNPGNPIIFPTLIGLGGAAGVPGLPPGADRVGAVLDASGGAGRFVVLPGRIVPVTDLTAALLLAEPGAPGGMRWPGTGPAPSAGGAVYQSGVGWPRQMPERVNGAGRGTVCAVYRGRIEGSRPALGVWAGGGYPAPVPDGGGGDYVTPASGLLYRQVAGTGPDGATDFLVTDTGLRYPVPTAADLARLGYRGMRPVPVPAAWSAFLPLGPDLDTAAALRPQGE